MSRCTRNLRSTHKKTSAQQPSYFQTERSGLRRIAVSPGLILGPRLWMLFANRIIKRYMEKQRFIISYADGSAILKCVDTMNVLEHQINDCVESFGEICDNLQLNLSPSKSMAIVFGRITMENRSRIFKLLGNSITVIEKNTYLGFTVNSRFNCMAHLYNIRNKMQGSINLRKTSCRDKGLKNDLLKICCKSVIEKQIPFGH